MRGKMTRGFTALLPALAVSIALTACSSTADLRPTVVAQWKAYCAAKGKQFLWKDTKVSEDLLVTRVQAEGRCVGPGERGYRAPEPPEDEP
jgi:hypothetical protein